MLCRNAICTFLSLFFALSALAQTKVLDNDGEPLMGAVVMDSNGTPMGVVDKDGNMPSAITYPVTIHCLGYEDLVLDQPTEHVVLKEKTYQLRELSVKPGDRPACRLICYIRETSGVSNGTDTMRLSAQYMADYMFKIYDKAKKVPTWDRPRVLNSLIEDYSSTGKEIDKTDRQFMSWFKLFGKVPYKSSFPESFKGLTSGNKTVKSEKTGEDKLNFRLTPNQYSVREDVLADYKDHVYSPDAFKLLGATTDLTDYVESLTYNFNQDERYDISNLTALTLSFKALGRGKLYRKAFFDGNNDSPIEIYTYIEIYPVDIKYLTAEEAKEIKKDSKQKYPMKLPMGL